LPSAASTPAARTNCPAARPGGAVNAPSRACRPPRRLLGAPLAPACRERAARAPGGRGAVEATTAGHAAQQALRLATASCALRCVCCRRRADGASVRPPAAFPRTRAGRAAQPEACTPHRRGHGRPELRVPCVTGGGGAAPGTAAHPCPRQPRRDPARAAAALPRTRSAPAARLAATTRRRRRNVRAGRGGPGAAGGAAAAGDDAVGWLRLCAPRALGIRDGAAAARARQASAAAR
jgi:hypothetical protein